MTEALEQLVMALQWFDLRQQFSIDGCGIAVSSVYSGVVRPEETEKGAPSGAPRTLASVD
jgi:hypothetical protein